MSTNLTLCAAQPPSQPPNLDAMSEQAAARERTIVWRYLRALGAGATEADDLAQETMLAGCRSIIESIEDRQAFLLGIARNQWLRSRRWWHRRRERDIADAVDLLWSDSAEHDGGDELVARLRHCLELLQPKAQSALSLHYRDGVAWHDIAAHIGMKPNGIKTLAQRARTALRTCIERRDS